MIYLNFVRRIILLMFTAAVIAGCTNEGFKIGNPPTPSPLPDMPQTAGGDTNGDSDGQDGQAVLSTKTFLAANPDWQGVSASEDDADKDALYAVKFGDMMLTIHSTKTIGQITAEYKVAEDGSLTAEVQSEGISYIIGKPNPESTNYPFQIDVLGENGALITRLFTAVPAAVEMPATFIDPVAMCKASPTKCFDADMVGTVNGSYHLAGFVQIDSAGNGECGGRIYDHCVEDGKVLAEVSCDEDSRLNGGYKTEYIKCNCFQGRCVDFMEKVETIASDTFQKTCTDNNSPACQPDKSNKVDDPTPKPSDFYIPQ